VRERITSRKNPLFQRIRRLHTSSAFRREEGLFLCEGPKLLEEAIKWGVAIRFTVSRPDISLPDNLTCYQVETPDDVLASLSDTKMPQGVLFACPLPDTALPACLKPGRYLVLDGIQDPGNLGTIWRTASALGCAGLLLTGPCADPFGSKTVRATMGACFRLPVWTGQAESIQALLQQSGIPLYATALRDDAEDVRYVDLSPAAVVIGSEGRGVSEKLLHLSERTVKIPMDETCESLNAAMAAGIVLWEGYRGVRKETPFHGEPE